VQAGLHLAGEAVEHALQIVTMCHALRLRPACVRKSCTFLLDLKFG
jgi:hypothetical protein